MTHTRKKSLANTILILGLLGVGIYATIHFWPNGKNKNKEPKIIPETIHPASASVEVAKTEDGQNVATFLSYPKYYQDEKREWKEVKTNIEKADSEKLPSGESADYKVDKGVWKFMAKKDGSVAFENAGTRMETKIKSLVYFDSETKKIATIYTVKESRPVIAGNQIIWPQIIDGVDYKMTYINDQMKEDIILSQDAREKLPSPESLGIPADRAYLGFLFERPKEANAGLKTFANDQNGRKEVELGIKNFETEGSVAFENEEGEVVQTIEAGFSAVIPGSDQESSSASGSLIRSEMTNGDGKQLPLLKRFYKETPGEINGKKFLFSGSKLSDIKTLPAGDLLFDPTVVFKKGYTGNYTQIEDNNVGSGIASINNGIAETGGISTSTKILLKIPYLVGKNIGQIPEDSVITSANMEITTWDFSADNGTAVPVYIYRVLDQWTEGNGNNQAPLTTAGIYGSTHNNAQDKYDTETAYINDGDGITASETSVTVDNGSGGSITATDWPTQGLIMIDSEIMSYTGRTVTSFTGLTRGISGTTAATHADNATVDGKITWVESGGSAGPSGSSISSSYTSFNPTTYNTTYTVDIKTLVQDWVNDGKNNYGMMFTNNDLDSAIFELSDSAHPAKRPKITISYGDQGSGYAGLVNAYESNDTAVSPSSPGTATTLSNQEYATKSQDAGFWTTALSTTDNGYDSQVFKMQVPSATATVPITVNWKGHGESAATNNTVSLNIWNFDTEAWEELDSGTARYNDAFTDKTTALGNSLAINVLTADTVNGKIYLGGGTGGSKMFVRYDPSGDSFTDLTTSVAASPEALMFDSQNKEIYLGGVNGFFQKYNPASNSFTTLTSKISSFWSTNIMYALAFDSKNNQIYLGGAAGKFARYNPATDTVADLTSALNTATSWSTNSVSALVFDSANNLIYLGGASGKFAKYDISSGTFTNLTTTLNWGASDSVQSLALDPIENVVYAAGDSSPVANKFSAYYATANTAADLLSYLPSTIANKGFYNLLYDGANRVLYLVGGYSTYTTIIRYFPPTQTSQSLINTTYDAFGGVVLNASMLYNSVLYIGGNSGKFGKYTVPSDATLSGSVSSAIENYRDASGYAWVWVKATNEWSPPALSNLSNNLNPVTWTTDEGATGAVAYHTSSHVAGSWSDYPTVVYESDAGWKTSHSVTLSGLACATTFYYRIRSCDQWGSCTVSAENSLTTGACGGGTCLHLYLWDGNKWDFQTNTFGSGGLGKIQAGTDGYAKPIPNQIYAFENMTPDKDGKISVKEFSDLNEINYFDRLKLYSINIPKDYTLATENPTIGSPPDTPAKLHTFKTDALKLQKATLVDTGEDITEALKEKDDNKVILNDDPEKYDYKTIELDFGDFSQEPIKKLVVSGDSSYPQTKEGILRKRQFGKPEGLQVQDENGNWVDVPKEKANFTKVPPFEAYQVYDISNIFISSSTKLRIRYLYKTYLNQFLMDFTPDYAPLEKQEIMPESMTLSGMNLFHPFDEDGGRPDWNLSEIRSDRTDYPGDYTRYGDVSELMKEKDDKFVIMAKGDEVEGKYPVPTDPVPDAMKRVYAVDTVGYYKSEGKSQVPIVVDPLPFAGMSNFPYADGEYPYNDDEDYQNYLKNYNTRHIGDGKHFTDYLPIDEQLKADVKNFWDKGKELLNTVSVFGNVGSYAMHDENNPGSADTDLLEMELQSEVRLKDGTRLKDGVRLK